MSCAGQGRAQELILAQRRTSRAPCAPQRGRGRRTASLMMCHMSGNRWSHSHAKFVSPGRGAPNVYTCARMAGMEVG